MVAQNTPPRGRKGFRDGRHAFEARPVAPLQPIAVVPGQHGGIVRGRHHPFPHHPGQGGVEIEVQIGQLQQPEAVHGLRQTGQEPLPVDHPHVEEFPPHPAGKSCHLEEKCQARVEGDEPLETENTLPLVDQPRFLFALATETTGIRLGTHPLPQALGARVRLGFHLVQGVVPDGSPRGGVRSGVKVPTSPSRFQ